MGRQIGDLEKNKGLALGALRVNRSGLMLVVETHYKATVRYLPYAITPFYLPHHVGERTLLCPQPVVDKKYT